MRPSRLLVSVLALPALALAQDSGGPDPAGTLLVDALPPGADLVVHVPNVPRFLDSALDAGFGTADAWRDAFRKQLAKWGEGGDPDRLVRGGETLLRLADGEALVAGMELPRLGSPTMPRTRAFVLAMRSRAGEKELRAAVDDLVAGGLSVRYPAPPRMENVMGGRPVIALSGPHDDLWIRVEDRLVVASDHPIALGLWFRGLERVAREKRAPEDVSSFRIRVRWGREDAPQRWEGTTFLQREAVSAGGASPAQGAAPKDESVLTWFTDAVTDVPLFPSRIADDVIERAKALSARPLALRLRRDGAVTVGGAGAPEPGAKPLVGVATRGAWLRAIAEGTVRAPVSVDAAALAAPLAAVESAKADVSPPVAEWRPGGDEGEVRGPAWHGPVTFLALRTLRDVAGGLAPNLAAPPAPTEPEKPAASPSLPGSGAPSRSSDRPPGEPPSKPAEPLPPPKER